MLAPILADIVNAEGRSADRRLECECARDRQHATAATKHVHRELRCAKVFETVASKLASIFAALAFLSSMCNLPGDRNHAAS